MKPYSRKNGKVRVRNKNKTNSVSDKDRKNNFRVSNPNPRSFWDNFRNTAGGHVLRTRLKKLIKRGLNKENFLRYYNDKI